MDGAKSVTDTVDQPCNGCGIGRRSVRVEASLKRGMNLIELKILAIVRI